MINTILAVGMMFGQLDICNSNLEEKAFKLLHEARKCPRKKKKQMKKEAQLMYDVSQFKLLP